jgi:3',5'-cyclic AMP phosphodiesterase CpdA
VGLAVLIVFSVSCRASITQRPPTVIETPSASPSPSSTPDPVVQVIAAGDIASCKDEGDETTAQLVEGLEGTVLALGDLAYDRGTREEFRDCYGPSWGRFRDRTYPVPGNHEYASPGAAGYFEFFGERAGKPEEGWYSFDLGGWHIVALNSNCAGVGCSPGSPQESWLRSDLASNTTSCTLAYWHHPRFTSGKTHGNNTSVTPLWDALHQSGAEVVLSGHEHNYERFSPLDPAGNPEPVRGMRQFVVGTGGRSLYPIESVKPGSEAHNDEVHGVLMLTLKRASYRWEFLPVGSGAALDEGETSCH